jgi:heme-degrading monooxygenase HmoA
MYLEFKLLGLKEDNHGHSCSASPGRRFRRLEDRIRPTREGAQGAREHGSTGATVLRDASDPNEVLVLINWPSRENAHAFANDPSLREAMEKSGVIGAPRIEFYEEADS